MRIKKISTLVLISLFVFALPIFNIGLSKGISIYYDVHFFGKLTNRFTGIGVSGVSVHGYLESATGGLYDLGSDTTDAYGNYDIAKRLLLPLSYYTGFLDIQKTGYCREYYECLAAGQPFEKEINYAITPKYECTLYGYVKKDLSPYPPISGVTVKIYGVDYHTTHILYGTTTTNAQGYYIFDDLDFKKEYPTIYEVPRYYYVKFSKPGLVTETINVYPYPYPDGSINLGTVYMWGFFP
ncbi:MAG: hypothetical protein EAX90_04220 [Candidatus Heimdallarchaeota archaeon]|nr:hypothetical protein [Candidatus Heimdallarchaeota archaeon]